jgi:dehydrogenase/reductase SDR family protein 7
VYAPAQIVRQGFKHIKKGRGEKAAPALFSARAMRKGTALTLALDVAPYALVALVVFTAALGSPVLAQLCAVVIVVYVGNAAFGECDLASAALGDAPRSAYDGKVVWITGASQGLGETLAVHLGSMGAKLILSSRREETLRRVCDAARAAGARDARALTLDARAGSAAMREKGAAALALAKEMASGASEDETDAMNTDDAGVDYIFHVAGGSQHAAAEDTADEVDRDMFELNTMSAIALTKALLPSMLQRRSGTIVAVGSMAVKCPAPGQATYAATKAALSAFCHSLRGEVADRGVNVTVAHPGPIATGLGGQTRVIFGATLAKSTCDTSDSAGDSAEGSTRGAKVGKKERRLNALWVARKIAAGAALGLDEVVLATQPIMLLRNFMQFVPSVGYRVLNKVGPKRTRAARAGVSMYELK